MTNIQQALNRRNAQQATLAAPAAEYTIVDGVVNLLGSGNATMDLKFPCSFIEEAGMPPRLFGSGSVAVNGSIIPGSLPSWTVGVLRWNTKERPNQKPLYIGATIVINCSGTNRSAVTWECHGLALTNPITGTTI